MLFQMSSPGRHACGDVLSIVLTKLTGIRLGGPRSEEQKWPPRLSQDGQRARSANSAGPCTPRDLHRALNYLHRRQQPCSAWRQVKGLNTISTHSLAFMAGPFICCLIARSARTSSLPPKIEAYL